MVHHPTQSQNEVTLNGYFVLDSANAGYFRYVEFTLPTLEGRINKDGIFTPFEGGLIMDTGWIDTHCGKAEVWSDISFAGKRILWKESVQWEESCHYTYVEATLTQGG